MEKFNIENLDQYFDNCIKNANHHELNGAFLVTSNKGDIGKIYYFKNKPNEIRIFIDNFPGTKKEFSTSIPFETVKEFADKMLFLGLELVSEERRTTTNSEIGSPHWFNTLIARHKHFGEFIKNNPNEFSERAVLMGKDIFESSKELIRGFKFINK